MTLLVVVSSSSSMPASLCFFIVWRRDNLSPLSLVGTAFGQKKAQKKKKRDGGLSQLALLAHNKGHRPLRTLEEGDFFIFHILFFLSLSFRQVYALCCFFFSFFHGMN